MKPLRLEWVRSFVAAAEEVTYEAAALRLGVAQPTVWKHVRSISQALEIELFHPGSTELTAQGTELLRPLRLLLDNESQARALAADIRSGARGVVRVACYSAHVRMCLAEAAGQYKRKHPLTRIQFAPTDSSELARYKPVERLLAREVDLAVGPRQQFLDGFRLYDTRLIVVVGDNHEWRTRAEVSIEELRDRDLLVAPRAHESRETVERLARNEGFDLHTVCESADWGTLVALARNGLGVAIVHSDALTGNEGDEPYPRLVQRDGAELAREAWLQWRRNETLPAAVNEFIGLFTRD